MRRHFCVRVKYFTPNAYAIPPPGGRAAVKRTEPVIPRKRPGRARSDKVPPGKIRGAPATAVHKETDLVLF